MRVGKGEARGGDEAGAPEGENSSFPAGEPICLLLLVVFRYATLLYSTYPQSNRNFPVILFITFAEPARSSSY